MELINFFALVGILGITVVVSVGLIYILLKDD